MINESAIAVVTAILPALKADSADAPSCCCCPKRVRDTFEHRGNASGGHFGGSVPVPRGKQWEREAVGSFNRLTACCAQWQLR